MTDTDQMAAATREILLRIWDGDAAQADAHLCQLMQFLRDAHANLPPDQQNAEILDHVMKLAANLIQR
jgi:hypothetical protein